jgi:HEPN domain-containing protein
MDDGWSAESEWLLKAERDLASARALGSLPEPLLDTAIFHCQQAAEKALKAVLAWKKRPLQKTHNLMVVLDEAVTDCPELESLRGSAKSLNPYATEYRYPGEKVEPSPDEFEKAFAAAESVVAAVGKLIG